MTPCSLVLTHCGLVLTPCGLVLIPGSLVLTPGGLVCVVQTHITLMASPSHLYYSWHCGSSHLSISCYCLSNRTVIQGQIGQTVNSLHSQYLGLVQINTHFFYCNRNTTGLNLTGILKQCLVKGNCCNGYAKRVIIMLCYKDHQLCWIGHHCVMIKGLSL